MLLLPTSLHPWGVLLGDPRADVWNHVWGFFYVADALFHGRLPFHTGLAGGPAGGALYFIDCAGAVAASPLTWLLGPALSYNLWLWVRLAAAGFAAQLLSDEVLGRGPQGWVAGLAFMTSPYLLCELSNGITEVAPLGWIPLTLWAAARALRLRRVGAWALLGLVQGITGLVNFYYGLSTGILLIVLLGLVLLPELVRERRLDLRLLRGLALAGGLALAVSAPAWLVFKATLAAPDALILRANVQGGVQMANNATDPRTFVMPGAFQSVDLMALHGEAFLHSNYQRWSVILLAAWGLWAQGRRLSPWLVLALVAAVLGLGSYLWYDGHWVRWAGGREVSLPFAWLLEVLPRVSVTHPLRLSIGTNAVLAVAAGAGAHALVARGPRRWRPFALVALAGVVVAESLWGSLAPWPIPRSSVDIPAFYASAPAGMVLDLPAEAGTTMETSRYFWYQTRHQQPIPYVPDIRLGSMRDQVTLEALRDASAPVQRSERPRPPSPEVLRHWRDTYGMIVVHEELERAAGLAGQYRAAFTPVLGEPCETGGALVWFLRDSPCPR
ncbi:MAG: hypothetical protein ABIO70_22770 [Pseudomonadota bacterium]